MSGGAISAIVLASIVCVAAVADTIIILNKKNTPIDHSTVINMQNKNKI